MRSTLVVLALLGSLHARAMCAGAGPFVLPVPGSAVPANPTLFFFSYGDEAKTPVVSGVTDSGQKLKVEVTPLHTQGDLRAFRLDVTAKRDTRFSLEGLSGWTISKQGEPDLHQTFGPWTTTGQVPTGAFALKRAPDISTQWTCSHTSLWVLDSTLAAPAYRVEFAASEKELRKGKPASTVVQGENGAHTAFAELFQVERPVRPPQVQLGFHNCAGSNFASKGRVAVRVTALMADGSERRSNDVFVLEPLPAPVEEDWE